MEYYFHHNWKFCLADAFPMKDAMEKVRDAAGHDFFEREYEEQGWEQVTLPHTFNDVDLFRDRIEDAGSGQKRTCAFYRKWFDLPETAAMAAGAGAGAGSVSAGTGRGAGAESVSVGTGSGAGVESVSVGTGRGAGAESVNAGTGRWTGPESVSAGTGSGAAAESISAGTGRGTGAESVSAGPDRGTGPERAGVGRDRDTGSESISAGTGSGAGPEKAGVGRDRDADPKAIVAAARDSALPCACARPRRKVFIEFEGVRQTCYLYVNGRLAGYYEAGAAPFGFDLTPYLDFSGHNLIAVATDNTASRNIGFCIAETPNKPDAEPGSYLLGEDAEVPPERAGVGFQWNCNDFDPSVGGITRPVRLHIKPPVYLTLPLYSNLRTRGTYVYGTDYDLEKGTVRVAVEAEIRNELERDVRGHLLVRVRGIDGTLLHSFRSEECLAPGSGPVCSPVSVVPEDAYVEEMIPGAGKHYVPAGERDLPDDPERLKQAVAAFTASDRTCVWKAVSEPVAVRFWNIQDPYLYRVEIVLCAEGQENDRVTVETGFRHVAYDKDRGVVINGHAQWLTGYAQRSSNEWAAIGIAPEWMKDMEAEMMRESNAVHVRWMHVAASPADIRAMDRHGIVCTQPAGDKEAEAHGRQWDQRLELMRDVIIAFRSHPSILFWEAGNNSISRVHMRQMRLLKEALDPNGGRFMGCRTINTEDVVAESEYVGTMLNRHAARFMAEHGPVTETEYSREEAPRRVWDDHTPPDHDYRCRYIGKGGKKQKGMDFYDLTMEDLALAEARGYSEFFHDRIGGASGKDLYSACAALCWSDSAQHGRQSFSENARMSGRVDPVRIKKQNFRLYQVMQAQTPQVYILGHWNYPADEPGNYRYPLKRFNGQYWEETGEMGRRDPRDKTVYAAGSYAVARVELYINGNSAGVCEKPVEGFLFAFPHVDVTRHGEITAVAYDYAGQEAARHSIRTVGEPASLKLTLHTSPAGFLADGADICFADVEVLDARGDVCPLCDRKITFKVEGAAVFLGGYNSGRFAGCGRDDSVIHQDHVYAECGLNRVFFRSTRQAGEVRVHAEMEAGAASGATERADGILADAASEVSPVGIVSGATECADGVSVDVVSGFSPAGAAGARLTAELVFSSVSVPLDDRSAPPPAVRYAAYALVPPSIGDAFPPIPQADRVKYVPEDQPYCKVLVNGQEPDSRGVRSVNRNGSVWGAVLCVLERMEDQWDGLFTYEYDPLVKRLTVRSGTSTAVAQAGRTHLLVNGSESLMDGEPYVTPEGIFVMEINAIVPFIQQTSCQYDERVNVLRIERK